MFLLPVSSGSCVMLLQAAKAVHAAVEAAVSGRKKQDKLRAQVNHGFNQVSTLRVVCSHERG